MTGLKLPAEQLAKVAAVQAIPSEERKEKNCLVGRNKHVVRNESTLVCFLTTPCLLNSLTLHTWWEGTSTWSEMNPRWSQKQDNRSCLAVIG
jgi:hypothetical protein